MRTSILLFLLTVSVSAAASQPTGKQFGAWRVISINSLSGTGDDSAAILTQGDEPNTIQVNWTRGGPITVSMNIEKCDGDDDFEPSYSVVAERWLQLPRREIQRRLRADVTTWLDQARLVCGQTPVVEAFKIDGLEAAVTEFSNRLRDFSARD